MPSRSLFQCYRIFDLLVGLGQHTVYLLSPWREPLSLEDAYTAYNLPHGPICHMVSPGRSRALLFPEGAVDEVFTKLKAWSLVSASASKARACLKQTYLSFQTLEGRRSC